MRDGETLVLLPAAAEAKDEFHSSRKAEFLVDSEEIITDSVLAKAQAIGDFFVGKALGNEIADFVFAFG